MLNFIFLIMMMFHVTLTAQHDRDFLGTILKAELSFSDHNVKDLKDWYAEQKNNQTSTILIQNDQNSIQKKTLLTSLKTSLPTQGICAVLKNDTRWLSIIESYSKKNSLISKNAFSKKNILKKKYLSDYFQKNFKNYHQLFNKPLKTTPHWNPYFLLENKSSVQSGIILNTYLPTRYSLAGFSWNKKQNKKPPSKIKKELQIKQGQIIFEYLATAGKICLETNQAKIESEFSIQYQTRKKNRIVTNTSKKNKLLLIAVSIPTHYQNLLEETEHINRVQNLCGMAKSKKTKDHFLGNMLLNEYLKTKCSDKNTKEELHKNLCEQTKNFMNLRDCLRRESEY